MNKKPFVLLLALAICAAFLLPAPAESAGANPNPDGGVRATLVSSAAAVLSGRPGAYYIPPGRTHFHLRCPCGKCTKSAILNLVPGSSPFVWQLSGAEQRQPTLSPSIHWFELDGQTTHWHGWLTNGYFHQ